MRSKRPSGVLWIFGIGVLYLLLSQPILHLTGKWPAPYWLSVGLGFLLAYGLTSGQPRHLLWAALFVCLGVFTAWFFELGIHQPWFRELVSKGIHRYFRYYWVQKLPVVLLMSLFIVLLTNSKIRARQLYPSISLFALLLLLFLFPAELLCSISLAQSGNFPHGDYDVFGYRLGGYFLGATALCLALLRFTLFRFPAHVDYQ